MAANETVDCAASSATLVDEANDKAKAKATPSERTGDEARMERSAEETAEAVGDEDEEKEKEEDEEEDEDEEEEEDEDEDDEPPKKRQPNLAKVELKKPDLFDQLEANWVKEFKRRMAVPVADYDKHSVMGRINWAQFALVENEANLSRGHHALCPQIRCRKTGSLYRCKIVSAKRIHFNLTTLGFKPDEYEREIRNSLIERRFLFSFEHPFIRSGLGFFVDDNYNVGAFLEEFPHGTLLDFYEKNDKNKIVCHFKENEVKYLAAQIVLALEYMHCVGCVHRDVQAGNVLVDARGYVKLTDFAITVAASPGEKLYDVTCFRYYAAPEYFNGKGYSFPVDFYAFGLMLYELLTKECFSDQEEIFDCDGSVDWGVMPEDIARMLRDNRAADEGETQADSGEETDLNADLPSVEARGFVDDCLIYEPEFRPDRNSARFYDWFDDVNFEQLYNKQVELPWQPSKVISYQADVDEEFPLSLVLDNQPLPELFKPHTHLF